MPVASTTPAVSVANRTGSTRLVKEVNSAEPLSPKLSPLAVTPCLSSNQSSLSAATITRYTLPPEPSPTYAASGSTVRYPVNSTVPSLVRLTTTRPRRFGGAIGPLSNWQLHVEGAFNFRTISNGASGDSWSV